MIDTTPYTPGMREVLKLSRSEANRLGHEHIGPEQYLLAVLCKGSGFAFDALTNLHVELDKLKLEIERRVETGKASTTGLFSTNAEAKRVLETARAVASSMKHGWVGTEHLLLALIKEEDTISSKCLRQFNVTFDRAGAEVARLAAADGAAAGPKARERFGAASPREPKPSGAIAGEPLNPTMDGKTHCTPGMREALSLSKAEAGRLGHDYIGPEHYLLAIIRKGDGLAVETLTHLDVHLDEVKREIERLLGMSKSTTPGLFSPNAEAKRVLDGSRQIASAMNCDRPGTAHLLLALIKEEDTIRSKCLRQFNVTYNRARAEVARLAAAEIAAAR